MMQASARPAHTRADVLFDAFYAAGIGGSIVALFFFVIDLLEGRALFTPSLMGSVLFMGVPAEAVQTARLDMVAYYTIVHFAAFGLLGAVVAIAVHELELHAKHPLLVGLAIFALAEIAFFAAAGLLLPGVVAVVGAGRIGAANLLAAGGIALFLLSSHRPDLLQRMLRTRRRLSRASSTARPR